LIWTTLGDPSDDVNWYTKRAILSGVYSATLLYWLGDDSDGHRATWEFLARRIDNVMGFEKLKAQVLANPLAKRFAAGPGRVFGRIHKPGTQRRPDLPGLVGTTTKTETQA
jgi:ubiquinone biosynthesis protein COQ9